MEEIVDPSTELETDQRSNLSRSETNRTKDDDDSFEKEHRVVNARNQYFNSAAQRINKRQQHSNNTTSPSEAIYKNVTATTRPTH